MKKFIAFTLAEVLITLGVIGIVAALTIPTLVANYQKKEYVSKLRKTYTMLNQAFQQYAADQGCPGNLECTGLFSDTIQNKEADWRSFVNNYLKVAKDCGRTGTGCFPTETYFNQTGTITPDSDPAFYKVILADGQSLGIRTFGGGSLNCNYPTGSPRNALDRSCASFVLDINGFKGPNKSGVDYFPWDSFAINISHFVVPMYGSRGWSAYCIGCTWSNSSSGSNYYCGKDANSSGQGCASRIIEEGWEMNY